MQKLLSLKLISKNPRNTSSQTIRSNPLHLRRAFDVPPPHHHHGFSRYTTSPPPLQQAPTNCLMKVLANPVLLKRVLPNALLKLKVTSKFLVDHGELGFLKAQLRRQTFQFIPPVNLQKTWQSELRRRRISDGVVIGLILTNVAVFLLWRVSSLKFMLQNFMIQLDDLFRGRFHTMITSAFSHYQIGHIVPNMTGLYFFGKSIGRNFGPKFLLKVYLAGAFVGSAFFLVHQLYIAMSTKPQDIRARAIKEPMLGASGALNAIMLLDIFLFPTKTIYLVFIIPVPTILLGMFLVGHDMMIKIEGNSYISGSAHLGGVAVAAIAWARLRKGRF